MANTLKQIDREIAELEKRLEKLRALRSVIADDPDLAYDLPQILLRPVRDGQAPVIEPVSALAPDADIEHSTPQLEKLLALFRENGNEWRSLRELSESLGISHNSISFLLYTSRHQSLFERGRNKQGRVAFRLKPPKQTRPRPKWGPNAPSQKTSAAEGT